MKSFIFIIFFVLMVSYDRPSNKIDEEIQNSSEIDSINYAEVISSLKEVLKKDGGKFWNHKLYGPILIVNPFTREFVSNEDNYSQQLTKKNNIYSGILPEHITLANTATIWNGKRWSMVLTPLPNDVESRNQLFIHELFHLAQPEIGFDNLNEIQNGHLDQYDDRVLLRLELNALLEAIKTKSGTNRREHIKNALNYRLNRRISDTVKIAENSLEINEGIAEYTALMLSGRSKANIVSYLNHSVDSFLNNPTFVRSFAYHTIPLYGFLLHQKNDKWHMGVNVDTDLTNFFTNAFFPNGLDTINYENYNANENYNYSQIIVEEKDRANRNLEKLRDYKKKFLESSTLKIKFENMNISFDPGNLIPLSKHGTIYPNLTVTDNFGKLEVENGALISSDWSYLLISPPNSMKNKTIKGDGWILTLNDGWLIEEENENFKLKHNSL